jgi:hypothetical protein
MTSATPANYVPGEAYKLLRTWEFRGYAHYSEWPKVADAVIEAVYFYTKMTSTLERTPPVLMRLMPRLLL